ncbi:hypothetical protein ACQBAU_05710 [Propionibacteriaceae bacterium Y2011]
MCEVLECEVGDLLSVAREPT